MGISPSKHIEYLERSLDFHLTCGHCWSVEPDSKRCWCVQPFITLIHVMEGAIWCCRQTANGEEKLEAGLGEMFVIQSGTPYQWGGIEKKNQVVHVHISASVLDCIDVSDMYELPFLLTGEDSKVAGEAMWQLKLSYACGHNHSLAEMIRRRKLGFEVLEVLTGKAVSKGKADGLDVKTERLLPVFQTIMDNLDDDKIDRNRLASIANLSPSRFASIFKDCTGQSPMNYVRGIRLREAQRLLLSTELSMSEIAEKMCFYDAFHFSRQFKKTFAISPTDFRSCRGDLQFLGK